MVDGAGRTSARRRTGPGAGEDQEAPLGDQAAPASPLRRIDVS
jgi:hypothetical protein